MTIFAVSGYLLPKFLVRHFIKARHRPKDSWLLARKIASVDRDTCIPMGARTTKDSWLERLQERG